MLQKISMQDLNWGIRGMGRIKENATIDFREYTIPYPQEKRISGVPIMLIPTSVIVSKKIGRTVYDVSASFDVEGNRSILQQFKELLLSSDSQN